MLFCEIAFLHIVVYVRCPFYYEFGACPKASCPSSTFLSFVFVCGMQQPAAMDLTIDADLTVSDQTLMHKHLQGGSMAISTGASTGPTTNDVKASSQLKAFSDEFVQDVPSFQLSSSLQKFAMQAHPVETPPAIFSVDLFS